MPRWAVIGWIISSCTCNVAASNAKLTLFYDWLFFDPDRDKKDIMNIEPAILCMFHSIKSHPQMTVTLLDFLCRIMNNFYPPLSHFVKNGIKSALNFILEKKVVNNLSILFENPKIDGELRQLVRECFPEFCTLGNEFLTQQPPQHIFIQQQQQQQQQNNIGNETINNGLTNGLINSSNNNLNAPVNSPNEFIVIEDDLFFKANEKDNDVQKLVQPQLSEKSYVINFDFNQSIENLNSEMKSGLLGLKYEKNKEKRCELMNIFINLLIQEELDNQSLSNVARCLTVILKGELTKKIYVKGASCILNDEKNLEESVKSPLFMILKELIQRPEEDSNARDQLINLLSEMQQYSKCIGYLLIFLNRIMKPNDQIMSAYRDLVKKSNKELNECLCQDLELCQFEEIDMFCFLVLDCIFKIFSNICVDNPSIIYLIVSTVDALQLQEFICQIIQGNLVLFKNESIQNIITTSLEWETLEQIFLWRLIEAHDISLKSIMPVLTKPVQLDYQTNSEALAHITLMLKNEEPSDEYLKYILDRDCKKHDYFTISILRNWARDYCDKLAELVAARLNKNLTGNAKGKKKSNQKQNMTSSAEQILGHLDFYREKVKDDMCKFL